MEDVDAKPTPRRCTTCGKFLSANYTEDQCEACLARDAEAAAANAGQSPDMPSASVSWPPSEPPQPWPAVPTPAPSWPPRPAVAAAPREQVPPPPAANPLGTFEPGIVIPRPSQLHPSGGDPGEASLQAPAAPGSKRSRWTLPTHRAEPKPPPPIAQASPRAAPAVAPTRPAPTAPLTPTPPPAAVIAPAAAPPQPTFKPHRSMPESLRTGIDISRQVLIAIAIGLLIGLVVPLLLSR